MDIRLARQLSLVAGEVYRSQPRVETILPGAAVTAFHNGSTQAFLIDHPTMVVVAFRGTEPTKIGDLWTDLQAVTRRQRPGMPGAFHTGFVRALGVIDLKLFLALQRLGDRPLYLTGHSLGGALAVIFAADLVRWRFGERITGVYTFGAPRAATPRAAQWIETHLPAKIWRFVCRGDFVPKLPPAVFGYRHVGTKVALRPRGGHGISIYQQRLDGGLEAVA